MPRVLIDNSYLLKLTPDEASVLLGVLANVSLADVPSSDAAEIRQRNEQEDVLIAMHDALIEAGVSEALLDLVIN